MNLVQVDVSAFAVGQGYTLRLEALANTASFHVDDFCLKLYTADTGAGEYPFELHDIDPASAQAGSATTIRFNGSFGEQGDTYDAGTLQVRLATVPGVYNHVADPAMTFIGVDDAANGTVIEARVPATAPIGPTQAYVTALNGPDRLYTNMLPFEVLLDEVVIDSVQPPSAPFDTPTQITLNGQFHNLTNIAVKFTTAQGVLNGTNITSTPTAISVRTPTLTAADLAATVRVEALRGGIPVGSNGASFTFRVPVAEVMLSDCSANLMSNPGFEDGTANSVWSAAGHAAIHEYDIFSTLPDTAYSGGFYGKLYAAGDALVQPNVLIRPGVSGATNPVKLRFALQIMRDDANNPAFHDPDAADVLKVMVDGAQRYSVTAWNRGHADANGQTFADYALVQLNLTGIADGATHEIRVAVTNSDGGSYFLVDDFALLTGGSCEGSWGIANSPTALNFGYVASGSISDTRSLNVINKGTTRLLGTVRAPTPFVIAGDAAYDLAPGQSMPVSVRFEPPTGTPEKGFHDYLVLTGGGGLSVDVFGSTANPATASPTGMVILNEVVRRNTTGAIAYDGARYGWIELKNYSDYPVNLAGWDLIHTPSGGSPETFTFPTVVIGANDVLPIFASGSTVPIHDGELHANFVLNAALPGPDPAGTLQLFDASDDQTIQSPIDYHPYLNNYADAYSDPNRRSNRPGTAEQGATNGDWKATLRTSFGAENPLLEGEDFVWYLTFSAGDFNQVGFATYAPQFLMVASELNRYLPPQSAILSLYFLKDQIQYLCEYATYLLRDNDVSGENFDTATGVRIEPELTSAGILFPSSALPADVNGDSEVGAAFASMFTKVLFVNSINGGADNGIAWYETDSQNGPWRKFILSTHIETPSTLVHELGHTAGMLDKVGAVSWGHPREDEFPKMNRWGESVRIMDASATYDAYAITPMEREYFQGKWKFPSTHESEGYKPDWTVFDWDM